MSKKLKLDVHPDVVARAFRVHRRTVFRWIENGFLPPLQNARIQRVAVLETIKDRKETCDFPEAATMLQVSVSTVRNWKGKALKVVSVLGVERISRSSIDLVLQIPDYCPQPGLMLFDPEKAAQRDKKKAELDAQHERGRTRRAKAEQARAELEAQHERGRLRREKAEQAKTELEAQHERGNLRREKAKLRKVLLEARRERGAIIRIRAERKRDAWLEEKLAREVKVRARKLFNELLLKAEVERRREVEESARERALKWKQERLLALKRSACWRAQVAGKPRFKFGIRPPP